MHMLFITSRNGGVGGRGGQWDAKGRLKMQRKYGVRKRSKVVRSREKK